MSEFVYVGLRVVHVLSVTLWFALPLCVSAVDQPLKGGFLAPPRLCPGYQGGGACFGPRARALGRALGPCPAEDDCARCG